MNRERWQDRDGHPPADLLLLHLERELAGRDEDAVRRHVSGCGRCRQSCEQLERGMAHFTAFRDSVPLAAPAPQAKALKDRLQAAQTRSAPVPLAARLRGLVAFSSPRSLAFAFGGLALCLILWLFVIPGTPRQSVYASQILDNARNASDSLIASSKVLNQKVLLRRGNLVIERRIHHGRQVAFQTKDAEIDAQFQQALALAHINLNDPLNSSDFADWRAAQPGHTDRVKENAQGVTITTRASGSAISEGSLTLSRTGWRPIARSVEFRGEAPIEISEESYEIGDWPPSLPEAAVSAPTPGASPAMNPPAAATEVSAEDLEAAELDLREAFRSIGADITAAPDIWKSDNSVLFHASAENPGQAQAIREAANRIPHVKQADHPSARLPEAQGPAPYTTAPPLAGALEARLGGAQEATQFLDSLRASSVRVLAEGAALDQLGQRYPVDAIKALSPGLRVRVNRLATSLLSLLQKDSAEYVKTLSPTLDEMAQELNVAAPADDGENLPVCLAWQQNAALAAPRLRNLDSDVSLLFVATRTEKPVAPVAEKLIADSLRSRAFLQRHLMSTCQLFGAN